MSSESLPLLWVAPRLSNGLGNRLFQLANAKNMADVWSMPLVFAMNYVLPSEHGDFESIFKMFPLIPKVWKAEPQLCIEHNGVSAFQYIPLPPNQPSDTVLLKGSWIAAKYLPETLTPNWKFAIPEWQQKDYPLDAKHLEPKGKLQKAKLNTSSVNKS